MVSLQWLPYIRRKLRHIKQIDIFPKRCHNILKQSKKGQSSQSAVNQNINITVFLSLPFRIRAKKNRFRLYPITPISNLPLQLSLKNNTAANTQSGSRHILLHKENLQVSYQALTSPARQFPSQWQVPRWWEPQAL